MIKTRILIVEDEAITAAALKRELVSLGYAIAGTAGAAPEALRAVEENPPDLILMDITLAGGIDGITAAVAVRGSYQVPVVFLTAHADHQTMERAAGAGAFGYVLKPFTAADLKAAIGTALHKHHTEMERHEREAERLRLELAMLEDSDRERSRIGEDLHDGIGQRLTAASLAASGLLSALETAAPALAPQAENLGRQLREAIAEVRALSHGLAPVTLAEEGLMHALHELADATTRSTGVRCIFDCPEPIRIPQTALAGHLYRIAQEAVTNALKHASAREIRIGLERRGASIILEVDDDGEGLAEPLPPRGGIGLRLMRHRATLIGGALVMSSPPAGGTRVSCSTPTNS